MNTSHSPADFLLRAEIQSAKETVVSYARELTKQSVLVVTDWRPPVNTEVRLRISLPSLFDPIEVKARVSEHRAAGGVGSPAGLKLEFTFDSPSSREALERVVDLTSSSMAGSAPRREYKVLLVEDNGFIRDMFAYGIAKYFAQRGGNVHFDHAPDAASAWQKLAGDPYDLMIVDYYLPAEDGAALITRLRRDERFSHSPVVAISVGGKDAREATISAGADLFLDKPIVLRDLFSTLQLLSYKGAIA
jgi:CheY-like chemotaxis protein